MPPGTTPKVASRGVRPIERASEREPAIRLLAGDGNLGLATARQPEQLGDLPAGEPETRRAGGERHRPRQGRAGGDHRVPELGLGHARPGFEQRQSHRATTLELGERAHDDRTSHGRDRVGGPCEPVRWRRAGRVAGPRRRRPGGRPPPRSARPCSGGPTDRRRPAARRRRRRAWSGSAGSPGPARSRRSAAAAVRTAPSQSGRTPS